MNVTKFSVEHATAVFVLVFCLLIGGLISYGSLPREAAPDIPIPIVIVSTPYFGVSPSDMETLVTQPMENEFKSLRGLKQMTSTSAESVSLVTIEFETDVNIEEALQKVREKVDKVKPDLPPDAEEPEVIEINPSDWPVLIANVSGDMDPVRLKGIGEAIQDDLEKISGVLRVDLAGGVEREIQVLLDPDKMRQYKVSSGQVIGTIQAENINLPGGSIEVGSMKYLLRVPGEFEDLDTIRDLVVKAPEGQQVRIRDVGQVIDTYKEQETYSRLTSFETGPDGKVTSRTMPNISLSVVKRSGENIIEIAEASKTVINEYKVRMEPGVSVKILNDMSKDIKASVTDLENNIISGMILVIAVLFFFMGGARNALMVSISVPLSMLISFIVLDALGITLNMVVLFSLMLALGMLVDNAIVIVENIYRHASEGKPLHQAALDGTNEVGWAIIASTATTVGAFFPMVFWPGVMGKFMGYLPRTVIITLIASLFVALIINPAVAAVFLRVKRDKGGEIKATNEYDVPDNAIYKVYRSLLEWSLNHRLVIIALSIATFIGTFVVFGKSNAGVEFFPGSTAEQFTIKIETADGSRLEATDDLVKRVVDPLDGKLDLAYGFTPQEKKELEARLSTGADLVEAWIEDVGTGGGSGMVAGGTAPHYAKISVDLLAAEDQQSDPDEFMEALRDVYQRVPGATIILEVQEMGPPSGKPVSIEIVGEDLKVSAKISRDIKERIRTIPGIIDLDDDVELSRPEILVRVDRERAALVKTDTNGVAMTVRTAVNGTKASVFREGDEEYDITVKYPESRRADVNGLQLLTVSNRDGDHIPLTEVADISVEGGSGSIRHKDQDRVVSVSANAAAGYLPADLLKAVQTELSDYKVPPGYEIRYTGENKDQEEAAAFLGRALLIALFIIALILVTQFNSISQPLIILSSVLLSLIGVLWGLIIAREPFGIIMTGIGIISLAGVVVNNSIVLIDYANQLRNRGMSRRDAVMTAGLVRFRPVLLTAATTILGLVPLVIGVSVDFINQGIVIGGRSVDMWGPMARAVSSGLLVATVLTLVVVPVLYSFFDDISLFFMKIIPGMEPPVEEVTMTSDGKAPGEVDTEEVVDADENDDAETTAQDATDGAVGTVVVLVLSALIAAFGMGFPGDAFAQGPVDGEKSPVVNAEGAADGADGEDKEGVFSTPTDVVEGDGFSREEQDKVKVEIAAARLLDLDAARKLARENSFDVKIAMTNIQVADATISKAYTTLFPTIVARFQSTLYDSAIEADFGGGFEDFGVETEPIIIRPQVDYNFTLNASMRLNAQAWPLLQQAYMNKELSQQQISVIRDEMEFAVVQTYYNALLTRRVLDIAAERVASDRRQLRATEKRRAAGVAKPYELTRAKLRVTQSEQEYTRAMLSFEQLRSALAFLLQTEPDFDVVEVSDLELDRDLKQLKQEALSKRPSVRIQSKVVELNEKGFEEIYWKYLPTMEVSAMALRPRGSAFSPGRWQYSLGLTAQWVLWDGGLREAELDERHAKLVSSKLEREKTKAQVHNELEQAWTEYLSTRNQLASSRTQVELAQDGLDEAERAYRLGVAQQLDVIFAQDQLRVTQLAVTQDELRVQLAIRKLHYLAGLD